MSLDKNLDLACDVVYDELERTSLYSDVFQLLQQQFLVSKECCILGFTITSTKY